MPTPVNICCLSLCLSLCLSVCLCATYILPEAGSDLSGARAPADDLGRGQTGLYELPGRDGHVSTATVGLSNGLAMPLVGYGAFQMGSQGIRRALDAGYRLIDTAESYHNEKEVGAVLHEFLGDNPAVRREDIWIVSKNSSSRGNAAARTNLERQLAELQVDYIDLYYLHSWENDPAWRAETWAVMEEYYAAGKIKALGISNHCASVPSLQACKPASTALTARKLNRRMVAWHRPPRAGGSNPVNSKSQATCRAEQVLSVFAWLSVRQPFCHRSDRLFHKAWHCFCVLLDPLGLAASQQWSHFAQG